MYHCMLMPSLVLRLSRFEPSNFWTLLNHTRRSLVITSRVRSRILLSHDLYLFLFWRWTSFSGECEYPLALLQCSGPFVVFPSLMFSKYCYVYHIVRKFCSGISWKLYTCRCYGKMGSQVFIVLENEMGGERTPNFPRNKGTPSLADPSPRSMGTLCKADYIYRNMEIP